MNKTDLVNKISESLNEVVTKKDITLVLNSMIDTVQGAVANNDSVVVPGFGTFKQGFRNERTGRNPKTGEAITIPSAKTVKFSAGKAFKEAVNG